MSLHQAVTLALVVIAVAAFLRGGYTRRKARRVATSWNCFRCGIQLEPMNSTTIRVAGSELAVSARACLPCARRDAVKWWLGMGIIVGGFAVTLFFMFA